MVDIYLATLNCILTLLTAYLGVHITMHPAETNRSRNAYKVAFCACGILICFLSALQARRNHQSSEALAGQIGRIELNTKSPPTVQVNVPPALPTQIVVERENNRDLKAVITQDRIHVVQGLNAIETGKRLGVAFAYKNIGTQQASDLIMTMLLQVVDMSAPNAEMKLHEYFQQGVKHKMKEIASSHIAGVVAEPQNSYFLTSAPTDILTDAQVKGIENGTQRIYFLEKATWKDTNRSVGHQEICLFVENSIKGTLTDNSILWRTCSGGSI